MPRIRSFDRMSFFALSFALLAREFTFFFNSFLDAINRLKKFLQKFDPFSYNVWSQFHTYLFFSRFEREMKTDVHFLR